MMSSYSLLFMHHVADNSCSHPQIPPPFKAHTLLLSTAHCGERKSHSYSCTPVFKLASQSSLSTPGVSGEIEKECLLLDDGGWWGRKSTSHRVLVVYVMHTPQVIEFSSSNLEK